MVEGVSLLLQGRSEDLKKNLQHEMETAARELRFEEAARVRDRLVSGPENIGSAKCVFLSF